MRPYALIPLSLLACAAFGADGEIADLRFGLGGGPMPDDQHGDLSGTPASDGYGGGPGVSARLGVQYGSLSPFGLLWGGEWNHVSGSMDMVSQDGAPLSATGTPAARYSQNGLVLNGGVGVRTGGGSHLEILVLAGPTWVNLDSKATTGTSRGRGNGFMKGGRVGWYWTCEDRWQYGLEADWTFMRASLITDYAATRYDSTVENAGISARATLGYRF